MQHLTPATLMLTVLSLCPASSRAAETLRAKIIVLVREKSSEPPRPFVDVGGFLVRRSTDPFKNAACPDASNGKGEVVCRITCDASDPDLRLHIVAPPKEKAPIVAGYTPPISAPLEITACSITTPLPVEFVYRSAEVVLREMQASAPEVYRTIFAGGLAKPSIKPFAETSDKLRVLAAYKKNRTAILDLSQLAAYTDAAASPSPTWSYLSQYAVGGQSVVFEAMVKDTLGAKAYGLVEISSDPAEFQRAVLRTSKKLEKEPSLDAREIQFFTGVAKLKKDDPSRATEHLMMLNDKLYGASPPP